MSNEPHYDLAHQDDGYDMDDEEARGAGDWLKDLRKRNEMIDGIMRLARLKGERVTEQTRKILEEQTDRVLEKTFMAYL